MFSQWSNRKRRGMQRNIVDVFPIYSMFFLTYVPLLLNRVGNANDDISSEELENSKTSRGSYFDLKPVLLSKYLNSVSGPIPLFKITQLKTTWDFYPLLYWIDVKEIVKLMDKVIKVMDIHLALESRIFPRKQRWWDDGAES